MKRAIGLSDYERGELRPLDGQFRQSAKRRASWCKKNQHPKVLLNLSLSSKYERDVMRCICGEVDDAKDIRA